MRPSPRARIAGMTRRVRSFPVGKIMGEAFAKLLRRFRLRFAIRNMDDDRDRLVGGQFARPTDDVFLCLMVEIAFVKRKRVEAVKQLSDRVDAKLYRLGCACCHNRVPALVDEERKRHSVLLAFAFVMASASTCPTSTRSIVCFLSNSDGDAPGLHPIFAPSCSANRRNP
jgi:hypothetical protein